MPISTDALIGFWGTQDQVDDGTTGTVADNAFSEASSAWTNDDDALIARAVLECQFDTTMPTVGTIDLFVRPLNVQSSNDPGVPDANNLAGYVGSFAIDFGVANDVNFFTVIDSFRLRGFQTSQIYEFYFRNNNTGQTIGIDWNLWIQPFAPGPHG